jgi:hypothetical protein
VSLSPRLAIGFALLSIATVGFGCSAQEPPPAPSETSQAPEPQEPQGSVTGTVYCSDTNMPARLAEVVLRPASGESADSKLTAATDLEGHFSIGKVPDGKYFIVANYAGYLNPLGTSNQVNLDAMDPEARRNFESRLTSVTVSSKVPTPVSLRLERAAEIDGAVQYDDGSPAILLQVSVKSRSAPQTPADTEPHFEAIDASTENLSRLTDDHGRFRLVGFAPGEYLVSVSVPTMSSETAGGHTLADIVASTQGGSLTVYLGGGLRASKAKPIKVGSGEAFTDANITIPLSTLHTIRGHIILKSNGEAPPAASLQLLYADTREPARVALANGGDFAIPYVPEGSFILRAAAISEPLPKLEMDAGGGTTIAAGEWELIPSDTSNQEGVTEMPVLVTADLSGVTITVPDPPAKKPDTAPEPAPPGTPPTTDAPQREETNSATIH